MTDFPLTPDSAGHLAQMLENDLHAPFVAARKSTLGGAHRPSVHVKISLDPRDEWSNGIFENSRYVNLSIWYDGEIALNTDSGIKSSWRPVLKKRWRKTQVKSFDEAVAKINKYLAEAA